MPGVYLTNFRIGPTQNISVGASANSSTVFGSQTYAIRIVTTNKCWYAIGQSPTAAATTGNGVYLEPQNIEVIRVSPGEKLSVITDTGSGTFNLAELTS